MGSTCTLHYRQAGWKADAEVNAAASTPVVFSALPRVSAVSLHQRMLFERLELVHNHGAQGAALLLAR